MTNLGENAGLGEQTIEDSKSLEAALDKLPKTEPTYTGDYMDQTTPAPMAGMDKIYNINVMKGKKGGFIIVVNGGVCAKSTFREAMDFIIMDAAVVLEETTPPARPPIAGMTAAELEKLANQGQQKYPTPPATPAAYYDYGDEPPSVLKTPYQRPYPPSNTDQLLQTIKEAPVMFFGVFLTCVGAVIGFMGGVKLF